MEKRYTVLIVDDAEHNIELMSDMLKESYDLITADNGINALRIMRSENRPDVVLLDMLMPKPDGYDVLQIMSEDEELRSIPVVVVTADSDPEAQDRSYKLGAVDFVSRGEDMNFIRYRVRSVLRLCEIDKMRRENERLQRAVTSERQLSALMDNLPGGVAIIRTDGKRAECAYFNSKLPALFRMNSDRFAMQFVMPVHPEWLNTLVEKAKGSDSFTFSFAVSDRNDPDICQWIRVTAGGIGERDGMNEMYCVFLDINAEKRQELRAEESGRQLRENQSRLETVVNNAPGGITLSERGADGRFHIMFINRGLVDMLGYASHDECLRNISSDPSIGVSDADVAAIREKIAKIPEEGGHFKYAFRFVSVKGSELWLTMRCQLVRGEDGKMKMYAFITNITKEKRFENELRAAAYFDPLTGLFNRHAFILNARRVIDDNPLTEFSLMKLNIGSFKVVNDLLGRDVGDKVLKIIADAVRGLFTNRGVFARFFADNFIVLTPYSERGIHPQMILNAVQKAVMSSGLLSHEIQYYIGVYKITDRSMSIENMTDRASIACRSINGSFQEHIAYYDEKMRLSMLEEQQICDESRRALQNGEFCVYYQPVYGIKAKRFVSAEALVRWNHPTKGMVSPGKFVPVFEKNGFIAELDLYVLEQVCKYMKRRGDEGLPKFPISVNISRMSLYDPNLFDTISEITDRYDIDPKYFRIEITESAYNDNPAQLLETIGKLREKCYPVLMDDFGSGYSSLNTLKDIPIDILKLDMKFMQGFEKNGKVGTIVTSVSRMSKWLNIPMLAEGVETKEQFDFLESVGCAYIQGFYFSRPVPEEEFTRLITLEEVTGDEAVIENYALGEEVNELLGSNALVSKLISGAFGGFGIYEMYDDRLEVIRVNDGYRRIMGYTPGNFEEERINIWDMMLPEDAELSRQACLEALRTDKAIHTTVRRYDRYGRLLYLEGVHRKLGGTNENPIICIAFNDITEKLASERQVDRSRSEIEEILTATGAAVTDTDHENGTVFYAGDLSDYGIDLGNISEYITDNDPFAKIVHPDDLERAKHFRNGKEPGKKTEEMRIFNKTDKKYYWWKFTEVRKVNDEGEIVRTIGVANNIDSEKRAKTELEQERAYVDSVMNKLSVGILTVEVTGDHKAHIIYSNDSFWKTIGQSKISDADFFGNIYHGLSERDKQDINDTVINGGTVNSIYHIMRSSGENAVLELTVGLYRVEGGHRVYMIIVSDITEQYIDRQRVESIVRNFHDGLALVNRSKSGTEIVYANDKFYNVLDSDLAHSERVNSMLETLINSKAKTSDVRITRGKTTHTVRLRVDEIGTAGTGVVNYIVAASDVTLARAESKNRIAERTANASAGLYDEVVEINYRARTAKLTFFRRDHERAARAKANSLDGVIDYWGKKYVHPDNYNEFREFINSPADNPDFTDSYCEIGVMDAEGDGEYHTLGIVLVRLHSDVCMMFIRDRARFDDSLTSAQVEETYRLYRLVAEQTRTAVVEINHVEKKISCSPLFKELWAVSISGDDVSQYEHIKQGSIVYNEDLEKYEKFLETLYGSEEPQTVMLRLKMADGSFKWCRITVSIKRGRDGRALTSLCTINFVHDEVLARLKAQQTDELLRRTVANIPVGVGVYKLEMGKPAALYVSNYMNDKAGRDSENKKKFYFDIEKFIVKNNISLTPGTEGSCISRLKNPDGADFWVSTIYRILDEGGQIIIYVAIADVTDRVESQRREAASEQMYHMLLNDSGTIVFDYDPQTDTLTYMLHSGENNMVCIEALTENIDKLTLIQESDRKDFLHALKRMPLSTDPEEMLVRICTDGYPWRCKALFKSVADEDGNVFRIVGKIEDVEDELARIELMQEKAKYDSLCVDIFNKPTTEELIRAELERLTAGALMMIDVDDFKSINDSFGHMFGDEFLKRFASTIKSTFRESDIVGRYGGDEFFVFMPFSNLSLAEKKAQQLLAKISEIDVPINGGVKSSIGISAVTPDNRDYRRLLKQADSALYQAKNRGKNCAVLFEDSMNEESYRTQEAVERGRTKVSLSSNPGSAASVAMRIFSALYTSADMTEGIDQMLALVGKAYDVSRVYIFEDSDDGEYCCNTFEWCGEGVGSEKDSLQKVSYKEDLGGNYRENMGDDGIFYCHDINELEDAQRDILARQNIKSVLQCAIMDNGKYKGFVGFDECRSNRFWTQDQIDALVFISKVLSIFLMIDRTRTRAENYAQSIKSILDDFPQILCIVDGDSLDLLYYNKMAERYIGGGKTGRKCYDEICGDPQGICPLKNLRENGDSRQTVLFGSVVNKKINVQASEVQWQGKRAYLLNCISLDDE